MSINYISINQNIKNLLYQQKTNLPIKIYLYNPTHYTIECPACSVERFKFKKGINIPKKNLKRSLNYFFRVSSKILEFFFTKYRKRGFLFFQTTGGYCRFMVAGCRPLVCLWAVERFILPLDSKRFHMTKKRERLPLDSERFHMTKKRERLWFV